MTAAEPEFWDVLVEVSPLEEIADPQGATIERSLPALGFDTADHVRVGKAIRLRLRAESHADADACVRRMCERLLVNPVIEQARIEIVPAQAGPAQQQ
ncbi:MAG TPA: phosphoribosylformylglycinamidine synthase subunit PurS [Acidimicrobiaceae bacterium]|nr:phosphoribosylformylglycinamidine synthase subunit PurS [Acidimicrobiaceae bacterium]HCB37771.1 phosphoribosylformylglycinamidine synthase subunit PurS [Acidimicrobiaceae bacterium]